MAKKKATILYYSLSDEMRKEDKLEWFSETQLKDIPFDHVMPDKNNNWINIADNDFEELVPLCDKDVKRGRVGRAIFELFSLGIATNRDEWVYDFNSKNLTSKIELFSSVFNAESLRWKASDKSILTNDFVNRSIKWTDELQGLLNKNISLQFDSKHVETVSFRPFTKKLCYYDDVFIHRFYQFRNFFPIRKKFANTSIAFTCISSDNMLSTLCTNNIFDLGYLKMGNGGTYALPLHKYQNGNRTDNITDWALQLFNKQYGYKLPKGYLSADAETNIDNRYDAEQEWAQPHLNKNDSQLLHEPDKKYKSKFITKEDIFHYVYAVLHNPAYREKYALNLKRDFPRIPLYTDFDKWATWGKQLMELHINYETAAPYPLEVRVAAVPPLKGAEGDVNARDWKKDVLNKPKLKADKLNGRIIIDAATELTGIPDAAWEYKLGNRSALEWILDQYKESKPKDPTIAEKFNTYRFADYQQQVIDLLLRVTTVSVETMKIVEEMRAGGS